MDWLGIIIAVGLLGFGALLAWEAQFYVKHK